MGDQKSYLQSHTPAERQAKLLEAAAQVGRNVTAILDLDELLPQTVDIICDAFGFYYAAVFLIEQDREGQAWAVLRAGRGEAGQKMLEQEHRLKVGGNSMIGAATGRREARIALDVREPQSNDVGQEAVRFDNPLLPLTRSEIALPLVVGQDVIGALGVQSTEASAFADEDVTSLQAMADFLAVAIQNARLLAELEETHRELVRTKTFEAIANATQEAIHWIGNKATPIPSSVVRVRRELANLSGDPRGVASAIEDLAIIENSAEMILEARDNLIGPTREQKPGAVMLQDVIKDTIVAMDVSKDIITYQIAADVPLARADPTQMRRVFANLIKNALEAMEDVDDKHLSVGIGPARGNRYVTTSITDNGCGISDGILDRIWVAFFTTKGSRNHPGLGLTACAQILEQMEGKIRVASRVGQGATFTVSLPVFVEQEPLPIQENPAAILIIDDDDAWCRFAVSELEALGYQVTISDHQGDYGIPALRPRLDDFDLIFVDDLLEQANALVVLQMIRNVGIVNRLNKTLVVTSSLRVGRTRDQLRLGVRDVLTKPCSRVELAAVVQDALEQNAPRPRI
jgi:signal transduction histidine kinase/ActR/RegA family two-component response regulator